MLQSRYSHKMQHTNYDCGVACVATILNHYNYTYNLSDLSYRLDTNSNGTQLIDIYKILDEYGFKSHVYRTKTDVDLALKNIKFPCIALLSHEDINHYVVIHGINRKKVIVSDPLNPKIKTEKLENFKRGFSGIVLVLDERDLKSSKNKSMKSNTINSRIINFIKTEKTFLILTFFFSLLLTFFGVSTSYFTGILLDAIIPHNLTSILHILALIFISFTIIQATFQYLRDKLILKMSIKLEKRLTSRYFSHLLKIPVYKVRDKEAGEFISRHNDALMITQMFSNTLISTIVDFLLIFISGYLMFYVSSKLFMLTIIPVLLYAIVCYLFFDNLSSKNRKVMEEHATVNSFFIQMLSGIENIKALNKEQNISEMNKLRFNKYAEKMVNLQKTNNISMYLKNIIQYAFPIIILWIGGLQVISSQLTAGALITFLSLSAYFFNSIQNIANIQPQLQQSMIAADRFFDIISSNIIEDESKGKLINNKVKSIRINNLNFNYKNEQPILTDFSMDIKENETICFIGESGSGKSTLAKLLIKFLETEDTPIYINDIKINDINVKSLREKICYINDKRFFITGTIKDNLTLGKTFTNDEIIKACKMACIHDFINNLDKGYDHNLLENSSNFSLGQVQRLSLARAFLHKPDVLILDEVLSNIDAQNSVEIMNNIKKLNIITIFVNHNSDLFDYYDKVYRFSQSNNHYRLNRGVVS